MTENPPNNLVTAEDRPYTPEPEKKNALRSGLVEILQTLLLALVLYFAIDAVFARVRVINISMQPTFYEGDVILVNKLAYRLGRMHTGDVVIFHNPNFLEEDYIKRLIGKPGDTVKAAGGVIYVNGFPLDEPYLAQQPNYTGEWVVPQDAVFVLGDNRNSSSDSHSWGFVPIKDLVGKALVVYWPLNAVKIITHPNYPGVN